MKCTSYNSTIRNQCVSLIFKELGDKQKSRKIERCIYNSSIEFSKENNIIKKWDNHLFKNIYISRIRSTYTNLKTDSYLKNTNFKIKILKGDIDCDKISRLTPYDIYPENWKDLIDEKMRKDKLKYEIKPEAMTDMFKCGKCKSRSCTYYEVQTRSADEPMTQFINCLECGNRWKQ